MTIKLKYDNTNTFFIRGQNENILIDTGYAGTLHEFFKEIKKNNIKLSDISYVIATHYHPDHMGLISELMKLGIKLLLIDIQIEYVNFSNEIFFKNKRLNYSPIDTSHAVIINLNDSKEFLNKLGIKGTIIHTPSHSDDSISIILDDKNCFVGDLEPIEYLNAYENNQKLLNDWNKILNFNPKIIYYAHINEKIFRKDE